MPPREDDTEVFCVPGEEHVLISSEEDRERGTWVMYHCTSFGCVVVVIHPWGVDVDVEVDGDDQSWGSRPETSCGVRVGGWRAQTNEVVEPLIKFRSDVRLLLVYLAPLFFVAS